MLKGFKTSSFGKVLVKFASAQVIFNVLKMIAGLLVVRVISPEIYGQFTGVGIVLGYVLLGHFGSLNGLGRELPYEMGKGNIAISNNYASVGLGVSLVVGVLAFLFFVYSGSKELNQGNSTEALIYFCYSILGFFHVLNMAYLPVLYRTNSDFDMLSRINIISAVINITSVVLVYYYSLIGLLIRAVIIATSRFGLLFYYRPFKVEPSLNVYTLKKLVVTGIPIYVVGQINPIWSTIQKSILFSVGGAVQFGYYALVNIVSSAVGVIPNSFSQVIYPRMSIQYGNGKSKREIIHSVIKPTIFQFFVLLVIAMVGYILIPILIPFLLPNYVNGMEAAQWALFIPVVRSLGLANNYFNVIKKQKYYFIALISGGFIGLAYVIWMLQLQSFNLVIFPQGVLLGTFIQVILSLSFLQFLDFED